MGEFFLGVAAVVGVWFFFSMRSASKARPAYQATDDAEFWYTENKIVPATVVFSSYDYPGAAMNSGAIVLVGFGQNTNKQSISFAIEVKQGEGVVRSLIIDPDGLAGNHKAVSLFARQSGVTLISAFEEKMRNYSKML